MIGRGLIAGLRRCVKRDLNNVASSVELWSTTEETSVWRKLKALTAGCSSHISRNLTHDPACQNAFGASRGTVTNTHCCVLISNEVRRRISSGEILGRQQSSADDNLGENVLTVQVSWTRNRPAEFRRPLQPPLLAYFVEGGFRK